MSRRVTGAAPWLAGALAVQACASPGVPPGGPPDVAPPRLVRVSPDTGAVNARPRAVVFVFDEVVSESPRGGSGAAATTNGGGSALEGIVTVSPNSGSVSVDWGRERISVRPRRGFRDDATYTVTLGPGIADIRGNALDTALSVTFSTGATLARGELRGAVFDWVGGKAAPRAVVEAIGADSLTYTAVAGEDGRFTIAHLPVGQYLVRGTVDVNGNRTADPREPFDTARATAALPAAAPRDTAGGRGDTPAVALYAFPRDTLGPRLTQVQPVDSVTLRLSFDRPLLPGQPLDASRVRVLAADSTPVRLVSVLTPAMVDSLLRARQPGTDSAAAAGADTARAAPPPPPRARVLGGGRGPTPPVRPTRPPPEPPPLGRPVPSSDLLVTLAAPLSAQAAYRVQAIGLRSLTGIAATSDRVLTTPRATRAEPGGAAPPAAPPARPPR
ncbi:MAG TPA: Ig-like domain-containing protein [Gemmatirosa sp.]|nr:Ig-like domain-containing protein [Gemmatirosa sp.]